MRTEIEPSPEPREPTMGPEAVAFMLDLGICPGCECPTFRGGCDARCPLLRGWASETAED